MKFCDAMDRLMEGAKVTRAPWSQGVYFMMVEGDVKSFQPRVVAYVYDEDIMISDGWLVDGHDGEFRFCDIILFLEKGFKARRKEWEKTFIYYSPPDKSLFMHSMEQFPFTPDFSSFSAQDWIELDAKDESEQ